MSSNQVSWRDYETAAGSDFGVATQESVDELNKALKVGQSINAPGSTVAGDGFALRVESLEATLKVTTYRMEHIKFWKLIPKLGANNTVEEYNEISSYGQNPDAGWVDEGDLPEEDDSSYTRRYAIVKYLGTVRRVSHQATLIKPAHGPVIARETVNGTMHLLRILERSLFKADSNLSALQFDGLEAQILARSPAANIIDLRGKPLSEDILTDSSLIINDAPNYGTPTHLLCNPKVKSDLVKTFFPKERYDLMGKPSNGLVGLDIKGFVSPAGDVEFVSDVFIDDGGAPTATAVGDAAKRPGTPTVSTAATTPAEPLSQFVTGDAGDYRYTVQAVNRYGRSAPVAIGAGAVAVDVGDKVTFGMTPGGSTAVDWYEIFRTKRNGAAGTQRLILRVKNTAGAGEMTLNDLNALLPYCTSAYLLQLNLECMSFKQLAPMVKIPLATIDSSIRWMQLLYGTPTLYTPGKVLLLRNVGRADGSY
jgi:hypothetical protein